MRRGTAPPDPEHMDRLEGFVLRRQLVAVTHVEQNTDNPPGRAPFREQEIVLAESEQIIPRQQVPVELAIIARKLPDDDIARVEAERKV